MATATDAIAPSSWSRAPRPCSDCTGSWRATTPPSKRGWSSRSSRPASRRNSTGTIRAAAIIISSARPTTRRRSSRAKPTSIAPANGVRSGAPTTIPRGRSSPAVRRWSISPSSCAATHRSTPPIELAGKTVGVQFHQGSHYATLAMLEGFMPRDEINVVHSGTVQERYEALMNGETDAATLMEPWITLGAQERLQGDRSARSTRAPKTRGARLDQKVWEAAIARSRRRFGSSMPDKRKYVHYLIEEIPEKYAKQLKPEDFYLPRLRYVDPAPYYPGRVRARLQLDGDLGSGQANAQLRGSGLQPDTVAACTPPKTPCRHGTALAFRRSRVPALAPLVRGGSLRRCGGCGARAARCLS